MLLAQTQVLNVYPAYAQQTESKPLPSVNLCKQQIPPGRRSIILQAHLQNIKKENCFCMAFYPGIIIPTGLTIGSSVVPHHIWPEPTKDHVSLPAGTLNYFCLTGTYYFAFTIHERKLIASYVRRFIYKDS